MGGDAKISVCYGLDIQLGWNREAIVAVWLRVMLNAVEASGAIRLSVISHSGVSRPVFKIIQFT
jgi:hypothetical protein